MNLPSLIKKDGIELKPSFNNQRYPCPFYGFTWNYNAITEINIMMDQEGNGCGLILDSHHPCEMERNNKKPNWNKCPLNDEDTRKKLINHLKDTKIFPKEFNEPINFPEWSEYILKNYKENGPDGI